MLIAQFDVPVREIDEVLPKVVLRCCKSNVDERPPFWPLRFADQTHVRFAREPVAFTGVAADTRANHIFPHGRPSAIARHDMIEIEFAAVKNLTTVLARVLVALEHIVASKFHFLLRKPIEHEKDNHARDPNLKRNRRDDFVVGRVG